MISLRNQTRCASVRKIIAILANYKCQELKNANCIIEINDIDDFVKSDRY